MFTDFILNGLTVSAMELFLIRLTLILLLIVLLIQLFYFWYYYSRLAFTKKHKSLNTNPDLPPVSIIICAHNEYSNLEKNIPLILAQEYQNFEVVVVNDCSDDGTEDLLEDFVRQDARVKHIHLQQSLNFFRGKKFPLSIGIKSAAYEHLLLTEPDCSPISDRWITNMAQNYTPEIDIVLGYSPYQKKPGILNWLIQYDTLFAAIQYFSMALAGNVFMGVGRNLSYKKSLFLKNKGFITHYDILLGDDDLFISQVSNSRNTAIEISPESQLFTLPKAKFGEWLRQKRLQLSTRVYYKPKIKWLLGTYYVTQILFYALLIALFFTKIPFFIPLAIFLVRLINQEIVFIYSARKLKQSFLWLLLPFAEIFFIIFNPVIHLYNRISKPVKWI